MNKGFAWRPINARKAGMEPHVSVKDDIRTNLKELMVAKGVKNVELARAVGVSKVAVTNWLNGSNSIDIEKVPSICDFFGVSIDAFLSHSNQRTLAPDESRLITLFRMCDEPGKKAILETARHSLAGGGPRSDSAPGTDS